MRTKAEPEHNDHIVAEAVYCYHQSISTSHNAHRYEHCLLALITEMTDAEKHQFENTVLALTGSSYLMS